MTALAVMNSLWRSTTPAGNYVVTFVIEEDTGLKIAELVRSILSAGALKPTITIASALGVGDAKNPVIFGVIVRKIALTMARAGIILSAPTPVTIEDF